MSERLDLTTKDKKMLEKWCGGIGFTADVAESVKRQGWISPKQRAVLEADAQRKNRFPSPGLGRTRPSGHREDYDESDFEIGDFENCVGWWKP